MAKKTRLGEPAEEVRHWLGEIASAKKREKDYRKDGEEVIDIYSGKCPDKIPFNIHMKSGIYGIVNLLDGRTYVGQAIDIWKRCSQHFAAMKRGDHPNKRMQRAFVRDGTESFRFFIIKFCEPSYLDSEETKLIALHEKRYNICTVGCSRRGVLASDETKKKLSDAKKGKQPAHLMTRESRNKAAATHKRIWHQVHESKQSQETIDKRVASQKARWAVTPKKKMSESAKARMSASARNRKVHGNTKITEDVVREIRFSNKTGVALSKLFSISTTQVSRIRNNLSWTGMQ